MSKSRCGRKNCYSAKESQQLLIVRNLEKRRPGVRYKCERCGWWHLARQTQEEADEDRRYSAAFRAKYLASDKGGEDGKA